MSTHCNSLLMGGARKLGGAKSGGTYRMELMGFTSYSGFVVKTSVVRAFDANR